MHRSTALRDASDAGEDAAAARQMRAFAGSSAGSRAASRA